MNETNLNNTNFVIYDNNIDISVVDPKVIFNMYYPPCNYNPDDPSNSKRPEPCIPFPEAPKPCTGSDKDIPLNLMLNKPCIYHSTDGTCLRNLSKTGGNLANREAKLKHANIELSIINNSNNFKNVKFKFNISDDEHSLLMLYNKILLFNQFKCQDINK